MKSTSEITAPARHPIGSDLIPDAPIVNNSWRETAAVTIAGGLLLFIMTRPAFSFFFFGENFLYLGQYRANGHDFWRTILSPSDNIFFRPVFVAFSLPWYFILPLDPLAYHFRNYIFSVVDLLLLHRVLVHLVRSRHARLIAFFFFAVSKIHLTTIGYINIYDSITMLMHLLLTILFFLRYIENRRLLDYGIALLFAFLSIFSKDYGMVVVGTVVGLVIARGINAVEWWSQAKYWALRISPLFVMAAAYLVVRQKVVGLVPSASSNAVYSPELSLGLSLQKLLILISTMGNLSFFTGGTAGAAGLSSYFPYRVLMFGFRVSLVEFAFLLAFMILVLLTIMIGIRRWRLLLFPLIWIVAYFGPTLLTRNIQMYYMYEPMAGMAVLLALCLHQAKRSVKVAWAFAVILIAVNGFISNYTSLYHWQYTANGAASIQEPLLKKHLGEPIESITFITASQPFWQYALVSDSKGPMLQELMRLPNLQVKFIDPQNLSGLGLEPDKTHLLFDIDNGFAEYNADEAKSRSTANASTELGLIRLDPARTEPGKGFNVQPDGQSAISIDSRNATPETVIMFDETPLVTSFGNPGWLTALVPTELFSQAGRHQVYIKNKTGESNRLEFVVGSPK